MDNKATDTGPTDEFDKANQLAQDQNQTVMPVVPEVDVNTIPEDVKSELVGLENIQLDQKLLHLMNTTQAVFTVDFLVVNLWTKYQKKVNRIKVIQRLRTLVHQGLVHKHDRARGMYWLSDEGRKLMAKSGVTVVKSEE